MRGFAPRHAESDTEVAVGFPVKALPRRALTGADERVGRQRGSGYRILAAWRDETPVALAGYGVEKNLTHGRFGYVDDLVTVKRERRGGIGARRLDAVGSDGLCWVATDWCSVQHSIMSWPTDVIIERAWRRAGRVSVG